MDPPLAWRTMRASRRREGTSASGWPLQEIRSLQRSCERANPHFIGPPTCNAHTVAIVLQACCAIYTPRPRPPFRMLYTIQYSYWQYRVKAKRQAGKSTEKMLRPWSQQARLTPRRGTVAHLGNYGCWVHIHTGNLSKLRWTPWASEPLFAGVLSAPAVNDLFYEEG